jgi:hypothetical protein
MNNEKRIETLYKEYAAIYGRKSPEFKRGWIEAIKTWQKREVEEFLDELYNDVEQGLYMKEKGALNE